MCFNVYPSTTHTQFYANIFSTLTFLQFSNMGNDNSSPGGEGNGGDIGYSVEIDTNYDPDQEFREPAAQVDGPSGNVVILVLKEVSGKLNTMLDRLERGYGV